MNIPSVENVQHKKYLAIGLVLVWLVGTMIGFWWFQFKDLQQFDSRANSSRTIFFDGEALVQQLQKVANEKHSMQSDETMVLHFWDPDCPCSRFNQVHVRELVKQYAAQGIRFMVVAHSSSQHSRTQLEHQARAVFGDVSLILDSELTLGDAVPSTPAAMVVDANRQLAYFGPYSNGAVCLSGNGKFVENILDDLLVGKNSQQINTLAYGCFCNWQKGAA